MSFANDLVKIYSEVQDVAKKNYLDISGLNSLMSNLKDLLKNEAQLNEQQLFKIREKYEECVKWIRTEPVKNARNDNKKIRGWFFFKLDEFANKFKQDVGGFIKEKVYTPAFKEKIFALELESKERDKKENIENRYHFGCYLGPQLGAIKEKQVVGEKKDDIFSIETVLNEVTTGGGSDKVKKALQKYVDERNGKNLELKGGGSYLARGYVVYHIVGNVVMGVEGEGKGSGHVIIFPIDPNGKLLSGFVFSDDSFVERRGGSYGITFEDISLYGLPQSDASFTEPDYEKRQKQPSATILMVVHEMKQLLIDLAQGERCFTTDHQRPFQFYNDLIALLTSKPPLPWEDGQEILKCINVLINMDTDQSKQPIELMTKFLAHLKEEKDYKSITGLITKFCKLIGSWLGWYKNEYKECDYILNAMNNRQKLFAEFNKKYDEILNLNVIARSVENVKKVMILGEKLIKELEEMSKKFGDHEVQESVNNRIVLVKELMQFKVKQSYTLYKIFTPIANSFFGFLFVGANRQYSLDEHEGSMTKIQEVYGALLDKMGDILLKRRIEHGNSEGEKQAEDLVALPKCRELYLKLRKAAVNSMLQDNKLDDKIEGLDNDEVDTKGSIKLLIDECRKEYGQHEQLFGKGISDDIEKVFKAASNYFDEENTYNYGFN